MNLKYIISAIVLIGISFNVSSKEYHVSKNGSDENKGSKAQPFKTISAAALIARPGDTVTVYEGVYREWVNPQYGGTSHANRILYRSANHNHVVIKGSEEIKNWQSIGNGVWKVVLKNSFFGNYNPYRTIIKADWFTDLGREHHTGEVYLNNTSLYEINSLENVMNPQPQNNSLDQDASLFQWYCETNDSFTTIWANFHSFNPNSELVEINVRPTVFFPDRNGINYITVRGFKLSQAATTWAPPTAEQNGLIGPNWSKGWIIENNEISHSKCSGISLGKERSTGQNYAIEYSLKSGHLNQVEVIFNAIKNGWNKENVGSHIVRGNTIFNCEQTGIVGNLGCVFSEIYDNHIYDIWVKRQWTGHEMAGIKLHAPIDVLIKNNCIHNSGKGIWVDWQSQGLRITGNLLFDNDWCDIHHEVNHGPQIFDNNIFLSYLNIWNMSSGTAFVNNFFGGQICSNMSSAVRRFTPYHFPHSTMISGFMTSMSGDDRYYNNIFLKGPEAPYDIFVKFGRESFTQFLAFGLAKYNELPVALKFRRNYIGAFSDNKLPFCAQNNVYVNGAEPYLYETDAYVLKDKGFFIEHIENGIFLNIDFEKLPISKSIINSLDFGEAIISGAVFDAPDGNPINFNKDFFYRTRDSENNCAGPFSKPEEKTKRIRVWPLDNSANCK